MIVVVKLRLIEERWNVMEEIFVIESPVILVVIDHVVVLRRDIMMLLRSFNLPHALLLIKDQITS